VAGMFLGQHAAHAQRYQFHRSWAVRWAPPVPSFLFGWTHSHPTVLSRGIACKHDGGCVSCAWLCVQAAPADDKRPLMVVYASLQQWKELAFLRYALGALRRQYSVVIMDLPGQVPALVRPPYMRAVIDYTDLTLTVLDAIEQDPEMSSRADTQQVSGGGQEHEHRVHSIFVVQLSVRVASDAC